MLDKYALLITQAIVKQKLKKYTMTKAIQIRKFSGMMVMQLRDGDLGQQPTIASLQP